MFGYVRPLKSELRVRELEQFKACYCALCHSLSEEYGLPARFILNYDFLFLAMLLWPAGNKPEYTARTCPVSPCRRRACCRSVPVLADVGAYSLILAYWKLRDSVRDDGIIRSADSGLAIGALHAAYKRASRRAPEFDGAVRERLDALTALEKAGETSLDRAADEFAALLTSAVPASVPETHARELRQILYHTGRWIYIIDAVDDLKRDNERNVYNPVASRFGITSGVLAESDEKALRVTLESSLGLIRSAFELTPQNAWAEIIRNIIYLGMPAVSDAVFAGSFRNTRDGLPR